MKTGIFFDGYHCKKYWGKSDSKEVKYNQIDFTKEIDKILSSIRRVVKKELDLRHKSWFQGIKENYLTIGQNKEITVQKENNKEYLRKIIWQYHNEHSLYLHLIRHGVESIFLENAIDENGKPYEKGIDTALTVNCMTSTSQLGLECVILCTNDSDFEPLIHHLKKKGVFCVVVVFAPDEKLSTRLNRQANLVLDFKKLKPV